MISRPSRSRLDPVAAALAFLLFASLAAGPALAAGESLGKGPDVTDFTLDNGLEVVVIPDHRAPVVTHMLWYKVGAADEPWGKSGMAHFFEHLMFKGTENHPPGEFSQRVAEIGGEENAFTSYDYTAFYQEVTPEVLGTMMEFEADRMRNLLLTDEAIAPERKVVMEERQSRTETDPSALLDEEVNATLYQNHPYRIPVIGWMREIKQLNRADLMDFYNAHYEPNNAVLIVAGDVDAGTVRKLAEKTYGTIPRGPDIAPRKRPQEPEHNTRRTVTLRDARVSVPQFQRSWVVPSYRSAEPGQAEALDLLAEILGGGVRSRLYRQLIVEQGIAASAGAYYRGTAVDPSSFTVYGTPRGDADMEDVKDAIVAEIARIAKDGVTEAELDEAKQRFVRSMIFARDSQTGMARIYGSTLATGGTIEDVQEWPERIRAVSAEDIRKAAATYLDEETSVSGYLLPEKSTTKEPT